MKKLLSLLLTSVLVLSLIGCRQQELPEQTSLPTIETSGVPNPTAPPETTMPTTDPPEVEPTLSTEPSETNSPTETTEEPEPTQAVSEPTVPPNAKPAETLSPETNPTDPPVTEPTQPAIEPTDPPTTQPTETEPPETEPVETQSPETEPPETEPPETEPLATEPPSTQPTEPAPTEPAGCRHDWICIHHDEEGHWRAGIACDCGWTVYGEPEELVALWNAHSASYPAVESLFNHGGYGSVDSWIVDKPAYDEWVCSHCGEQKP